MLLITFCSICPGNRMRSPIETLTDRELAVVEAIGQGTTMQQIADAMHLSVKTVETYRERAKRKLGLRSSAELMRFAVKWSSEQIGESRKSV
jgi:DNA-binding NarL/FixJ family response regulator